MQRISPARNPDPDNATLYRDFDQLTGSRGSVPPADFFNDIQTELLNLITGAGLTPSAGNLSQVLQAVQALIEGGGDGAVTAGVLNEVQSFTASGTWTPDAATKSALIVICGGGGAGGGAPSGADDSQAADGGGAETRVRFWSPVSGSKAVTIGAGGTGANNANGGDGGSSSVAGLVTATGGSGGQKTNTGGGGHANGGAAGTGGSGGILLPGSRGGGFYSTYRFGQGGASFFGAGAPPPGPDNSNGLSATAYGAGGSGCHANNVGGSALKGGDGGSGFCLILGFK